MLAEHAEVVRDEILRALHDPGEIADAEFAALKQRRRERQPCAIGECLGPLRCQLGVLDGQTRSAQLLRSREVDAEEVADVRHADILTDVDLFPST